MSARFGFRKVPESLRRRVNDGPGVVRKDNDREVPAPDHRFCGERVGLRENVAVSSEAPRQLRPDERRILSLLLSGNFVGSEALRDQAKEVEVVGHCDCGCPTIDLRVSETLGAAPIPGTRMPIEARVTPIAGEPVGDIVVFLDSGRLSSMEYVFYTDAPPSRWPSSDRLTLVEVPSG